MDDAGEVVVAVVGDGQLEEKEEAAERPGGVCQQRVDEEAAHYAARWQDQQHHRRLESIEHGVVDGLGRRRETASTVPNTMHMLATSAQR